jgi:GLPGLI family protein
MRVHILILFAFFLALYPANSQNQKGKPFKGKIVYHISYEKNDLGDEVTGMLPTLMSVYISEDKVKTDLATQLGTQSAIYDLNLQSKTALMDLMGSKYAISDSWETIQADHEKKPKTEVRVTEETKEIAGYNCRKVVVAVKESDDAAPVESIAWFTEELVVNPEINFSNALLKDVKGVLMEYDMEAGNGLNMKFTAFSVEKMKIPGKDFEIPEGYTLVTREELMQIFNK